MSEDTQGDSQNERRSGMSVHCRDHEKRVSSLEHASQTLKEAIGGMTIKLDLILAQVTKVAILEEKHNTQQLDLNRLYARVETMNDKMEIFVASISEYVNNSKGRDKTLWAVAALIGGTVFILLIKILFFMGKQGITIG